MKNFPTKEQMMTMPLKFVRGLDISTPEEEILVQEVVNERLHEIPVEQDIYRGDVPDIKTPEEEAKWQKIIDKRMAKIQPKKIALNKILNVKDPADDSDPDADKPDPAIVAKKETELKSKIADIKKKQKEIKQNANANQA